MRAAGVLLVSLVLAPAGNAACPVRVSDSRGPAPLEVTFHATCKSGAYRWSFGDGRTATGARVTHAFRGGRFTPALRTDRGAQRLAPVTSVALTVVAPRRARYGQLVTFRARVVPKLPVRIAGKPLRGGALTVKATHPLWTAVAGGVAVRKTIRLAPRLDISFRGAKTIGAPLRVVAILRPAHAGEVEVTVDGRTTRQIDTSAVGAARIVVSARPRPNWLPTARVVHATIRAPSLALGSRGPAVVALERRLAALRYAIDGSNGLYGDDDAQAVLAFQKVSGLEQTATVTPALWSRLTRAGPPAARYGGDHVEVDKARQVLFLVRGGKVVLTTHVSTGATGNTPVGVWHVYRKVVGWSWVLWYPSYFLRGFAIHGYPEVPVYPASHGCVRVPMWLAPQLFAQIPLGSAVYVY
jgi:lipoprotein-anchoring transpeptidase ErfK/SrfK